MGVERERSLRPPVLRVVVRPVGCQMYDASKVYLVADAIDRYSIGDRTAGLVTNEGGSVTIYIQQDPPDTDKQSNRLPTPDGRFRPLIWRLLGRGG
jgi:hypothetical protein